MVYKHSEETKQKISKSCKENARINTNYGMKGKHMSEESKEKDRLSHLGKISPMKGKNHTEETKDKISKLHLGIKLSEETKRKIGEIHKGKKLSEEHRKKISKSNIGKVMSEESKKKMSETRKRLFKEGIIKSPMLDKYHSEEAIRKIKESRTKQVMKPLSEEHKKILLKIMTGRIKSKEEIQKLKEARKTQVLPKKDTSIEIKIQNFLKQLGLEFYTHQYIKEIEHGYQCDILIPIQEGITKKTIIECFGTYWHNYPLGREIDIKRCNELREQGFRVLVFWENEIKCMELNNLQEVLI